MDKAKQFFNDSKQELKKVAWPTKQQTITSTWVVLIVTFVLAIFLGLVDFGLGKLIGLVLR
ncbi:MAG: preprotein translocase subunit SecE [Deltaproteobacteria bacterium RIFCSPLOWO2_02_FULL_53_8]|nr:MAG: preprotein translocase subunit SecE [Deltaproteobacteria bacterium RIFCSPLOWO2_02_FULL_53_8]